MNLLHYLITTENHEEISRYDQPCCIEFPSRYTPVQEDVISTTTTTTIQRTRSLGELDRSLFADREDECLSIATSAA